MANNNYTQEVVKTVKKRKEGEKQAVFTNTQFGILGTLLSKENKRRNDKLNVVNQYLVLLQIYETTKINNDDISYSELAKKCEKFGLDTKFLSPILDTLYDRAFINIEWKNVNGVTSNYYSVEEDFLPYTKCLYNWCFIEDEKKRETVGKRMGFYTTSRVLEMDKKRENEKCKNMQ